MKEKKRKRPYTPHVFFTPEEDAIIRELYPDTYAREIAEKLGRSVQSVYERAAKLGVRGSHEKQVRSGKLASSFVKDTSTRFYKGMVALNKGKKLSPERIAKMQPTMFKKGHVPATKLEVGAIVTDPDGYLKVKVGEPSEWRFVHRLVWEQANGPIPEGSIVVFRNGDKGDVRLENLELITRRQLMTERNAWYVKYPKELCELIHAKGVLNRHIHKLEKQQNENENG